MAKRGLKIFGIGVGTLVLLAGIIVGILFATGVIKNQNSSQEPSPQKHDPLNPVAPNPNENIQVRTILSNPKVNYENKGSGDVATGLTFNVRYDPLPIPDWTLHKTLRITFKSGQMKSISESRDGVITMDSMWWETDSEIPVKLELTAHLSYRNYYGNRIAGPESDTLTVNIPTN